MLKQLTQFKSTIQGVENYFHFDCNCPTNIAKEALFECLKWIGQLEDMAKAQEEAAKETAEKTEESTPTEETQKESE